MFFQGYYNGYLKPYQDVKQNIQFNVIFLNSRNLYSSEIRLVVLDILENNIVYYDKHVSNKIDPSIALY